MNMQYETGTVVYLVHTGDRGVVIGQESNGMYQVRLPDDITIPAFAEDLSLHNPQAGAYQSKTQATTSGAGKPPEPEMRYAAGSIPQPKGILLCLEALQGNQSGYYRCWLVNEMDYPVVMELEAYLGDKTYFSLNQKMPALAAVACGRLYYDELNDHPDVFVQVQRMSTAGLEPALDKTIRLKSRTVTHTPVVQSILDVPVWSVELFNPKTLAGSNDPSLDIAEYARMHKPRPNQAQQRHQMPIRSIREMAAFEPEIDLHIEALVANKGKMNNSEILRLQLLHFESFMDKAVRMNVSHVFIIHGVGEGVLKSAIAEKLRSRRDVLKFHNQYHPKYGYGATEVIFR